MTIYEIGILTHYYCCPDDHPHVRMQPPAWPPTIEQFLRDGLLKKRGDDAIGSSVFELTSRGVAFVVALMRVPLPTASWSIEWPAETNLGQAGSQET